MNKEAKTYFMAFPNLSIIFFHLILIPITFSQTPKPPLSSPALSSSPISFSTRVHHRRRYINREPSNISTFSPSKIYSDAHSTYEHLLVMPVGIGRNNSITPMLKTELIIDTGSSLTWVQSLPCESCYKQGDQFPYYNRFASETYEAVRCIDVMCRGLPLANHTECSDLAWDSKEPCSYSVLYGDGTTTSGVIGTDKFYFQDPYGLGYQSVMSMPFGVGTSNHIPDRLTLSTPGVTG